MLKDHEAFALIFNLKLHNVNVPNYILFAFTTNSRRIEQQQQLQILWTPIITSARTNQKLKEKKTSVTITKEKRGKHRKQKKNEK